MHIFLVRINLHSVGKTLVASSALANSSPSVADEDFEDDVCQVCKYSAQDGAEDDDALLGDMAWLRRFETQKTTHQSEPGAAAFYADVSKSRTPMTPLEFARWCRGGRNRAARVFDVLHLFAGVPRPGDIEAHCRELAEPHGFVFIFCSMDLFMLPDQDLS